MSHLGYILAAYGFTGVVVGVLVVWGIAGYRAQKRALETLEANLAPQSGERSARSAG